MPPSRSSTSSLHPSSLTNARKIRRFLFDAREPFGKKLEFVARNGGEILSGGRGKGEEGAEKGSARRERDAYLNARLFAEWTLSVLPTIVLDLEGEKKTKQKALGKAFGSLEEEEEGGLRTKANAEKLWRTLLNALLICQEKTAQLFDEEDEDEDSFSREERSVEEPVPFNPANANRMVKCFTESMKLFAEEDDGRKGTKDGGESVLSKCSDVLSNVLSASKYAPSLSACTEMCVVAFERFPEMREASLRLCARQLRRKDFNNSRSRDDGSSGAPTTAVGATAEKQQNVTKEFVDVLLSAGAIDGDAELMKLVESTMRLTVARESVLRYYPDAFEKTKESGGKKRKRDEKRKKEGDDGDGDDDGSVPEEEKSKRNQQIPAFIVHFAKRISTAKDSDAIKFAPWFFHEFCASKERKRNAASTKKIAEKALRDMREVFSELFGAVTSASSNEKESHVVHLLRALKTQEDVYEAYDDKNPPKMAIESFLVECFDGKKYEKEMNYANVLDAVLSVDFRLLEKRAESCISRVSLNGAAASTFLLNLMAAFATRRKLADFIECVGNAFKRVSDESEDKLHGMNSLFRSESVLKALETHSSGMLEGQREELFAMCENVLVMKKSTRLVTTFGMVVKSIHKGISDSFTLEQCEKLGQNTQENWGIYDAMAISTVVGDAMMNNCALFDQFIQHVRELRTTNDFISIFPCAMQALSNENFSKNKAREIIDCVLMDENKRDDGTDVRYDLLHQYASTWIPRASEDQAKRYFASRIKHRKFAALVDDLALATLWIDALRDWLSKATKNSEETLVNAMEALELQMNSLFSPRKVMDSKENEHRFFTSLEDFTSVAEEMVSKLSKKQRKVPSSLKTLLRVRSAVNAKKAEENVSTLAWLHRESMREALSEIEDLIPESAWLSYLEEYANASYHVRDGEENLFQLSNAKSKKLCFKDAMTLAVACKQMRDDTCDENDDEAMAAWVQKFERREALFESLVAKFEKDVSSHASSVCLGFLLAGLGYSLHARAKIFSSFSTSSVAMTNLMRTSSVSVSLHLDRALRFVNNELKGDLNTNTKAMTYLYGCISLLASPGIAFETEAFTVVFNTLLKNFEHFTRNTVEGAEMVLNELHRERTKCLRIMFESSSKEARRSAVQFATDRLHREDALARNALTGGDEESALLTAQHQRLQSTFWMIEAFSNCSKFAWRKTFDDEKNESLVDSLLHACEPHFNKQSPYLNRRRSLAILCNIVAKGDYECALSARAVGRIAHVSARSFAGSPFETQELDFDSFVLCCDIVTATLYHRKEQLKRSTNMITAAIAHLVDVLRQWASTSSAKIEQREAFIRCASSLSKSLEACKVSGLKQFYCAHILAEVIASVTATSDNRKIESTTGNEKNNEIFASIRDRLKPGIFKLFEACSDLEFSCIFAMYGDKGVGGARRVAFTTLHEEQKLSK